MTPVGKVVCDVAACNRPECKATGTCYAVSLRDKVCAPGYGEHDAGPWSVSNDGRVISSADFTHDVQLKLDGDFAGDEQRKRYAENLAAKLNATVDAPARSAVTTAEPIGPVQKFRLEAFTDTVAGVVVVRSPDLKGFIVEIPANATVEQTIQEINACAEMILQQAEKPLDASTQ